MKLLLFEVGIILILEWVHVSGHKFGGSETTRIMKLLNDPDSYNVEEPDTWENNLPVHVEVSIFIEAMGGIDISKMMFSLDTYLQMRWFDSRLNHSNPEAIELTMAGINKVWSPDLYFQNARKASFQNVIKPNRYIHIKPNGLIIMSIRVMLESTCIFRLHDFPFDSQECGVKMMSYSSSMRWLTLSWRKKKPIESNPDLELPELDIVGFTPETSQVGYSDITEGNEDVQEKTFSLLTMKLSLRRRPSHYISLLYVPNAIIVIISWMSFWIDSQATPARVTLCFTSFLTLTTAVIATSKLLPPVSYTTALGIWTEVCVVFVFGTLLEFAVVHMYSKRACCLRSKFDFNGEDKQSLITNGIQHQPDDDSILKRASTYERRCKRLDQGSRVMFPTLFIIFVVVYSIVYRPL